MGRVGILLFNLGGPEDLDAVGPFMYNLFCDPDILRFPGAWLLRKPLAKLIVALRLKGVQESYARIGGGSPILKQTLEQASALEERLRADGQSVPIYVGMRCWNPTIEETVEHMLADGITQIVALPLFPQFSYTTTGSCLSELARVLAKRKAQVDVTTICHYYADDLYLEAVAKTIEAGLANPEHTWGCDPESVHVVFSAHSLPMKLVNLRNDPYPEQIQTCISRIIERYFPNNPWSLCYQSKVGPVPWLEPYTEQHMEALAHQGKRNILLVPISFVSEHLETLYEIDLLYLPMARACGITNAHRAQTVNVHPTFIEALANLIQVHLKMETYPEVEVETIAS